MTGRLAVVSGGGAGIGRAITARLVASGHRVVVIGRRLEPLQDTRAQLGPSRVVALQADLTDPEAVTRVAAEIDPLAPVDVLVNNAGTNNTPPTGSELSTLADAWRRGLTANLMTAVLLTSALVERLRRPGGRLIIISSTAGQRGGSGAHSVGSYAAAKAGLHGWALGLARELGPDGITVNVLAPGYVAGTEIFGASMSPEFHARKVADTLVGRAGTPDDVAAAVQFLASDDAGYITGQIIGINGGSVLGR